MAVSPPSLALPSKRRLQAVGAAVTELFPSAQEPLATPPPGSGLKPVLGNYGFPFLGHLVAAIADPWNSRGSATSVTDRSPGPAVWASGWWR